MNSLSSRDTQQRELALLVLIDLQQCYQENQCLSTYMGGAQKLLSDVLDVNNLTLTLYCEDENTLQYVSPANATDSLDKLPRYPLGPVDSSPTAWMIVHRQQLLLSARDQLALGQERWFRAGVQHIMGLLMLSDTGTCLGALVLHSESARQKISAVDGQIFRLFAEEINRAVEKYTRLLVIDEYIFSQTKELEKQLTMQRKAEILQQALYEITATTHRQISLPKLYKKAQQILDTLLDASNIGIIRYSEALSELRHVFVMDEKDGSLLAGKVIKFGPGFSSQIIRQRRAAVFSAEITAKKIASGELQGIIGDQSFSSWMGAPMILGDIVYGVIYLKSYCTEVEYSLMELDILQFFANHLASAIAITQEAEQAVAAQRNLDRQQILLRSQNSQLNKVLQQLHSTEKELVQKQKIASLQALVSAVALHINTPLSSSLDTVQQLAGNIHNFHSQIQSKQLSKQGLDDYLEVAASLGGQLNFNLQRAAKLINSFKQVAVNQSENELRQIALKKFLEKSLLSLQPQLQQLAATQVEIKLYCDALLDCYCNVDALSQVIDNLILNSCQHAFSNAGAAPLIEIDVSCDNERICVTYSDNGSGMSKRDLSQLFKPFFSNSADPEHCGLGAHLIYNLVTSSLQGSIKVSSTIDQGLCYQIEFPQIIYYSSSANLATS